MKNEKLGKVCSNRHLPLELWTEILCRLPVKALLRFRCVSKPWLSLIEAAGFARLHLNNFKNNRDETHLLVVERRWDDWIAWENWIVRCSVTFEPNSQDCRRKFWCIISSIDGLVLLERFNPGFANFEELKVWNPSIRKFHELPSLPEIEIYTSPASGFMDANIGLGYDPLANDYKHVKLICENNILHSVAIYSLGSVSWKLIPFQGEGCSWHWLGFPECRDIVYFRGSLYFIAFNEEQSVWTLVFFDLSREVFSSIRTPSNRPTWMLVLIDGGCSLAVVDGTMTRLFYDQSVWVLESSRDGSESVCWTKRYSFRLENDEEILHMKKNGVILTQMHRKETMIGESSVWLHSALVASYNPETEERKILQVIKGPYCNFISPLYAYVESLNLLK